VAQDDDLKLALTAAADEHADNATEEPVGASARRAVCTTSVGITRTAVSESSFFTPHASAVAGDEHTTRMAGFVYQCHAGEAS
jgi:hypothetical protein